MSVLDQPLSRDQLVERLEALKPELMSQGLAFNIGWFQSILPTTYTPDNTSFKVANSVNLEDRIDNYLSEYSNPNIQDLESLRRMNPMVLLVKYLFANSRVSRKNELALRITEGVLYTVSFDKKEHKHVDELFSQIQSAGVHLDRSPFERNILMAFGEIAHDGVNQVGKPFIKFEFQNNEEGIRVKNELIRYLKVNPSVVIEFLYTNFLQVTLPKYRSLSPDRKGVSVREIWLNDEIIKV